MVREPEMRVPWGRIARATTSREDPLSCHRPIRLPEQQYVGRFGD